MHEEREDEESDGLQNPLRSAMQNLQLASRWKGIELGPIPAQQVLEKAERGEIRPKSAAVEGVCVP